MISRRPTQTNADENTNYLALIIVSDKADLSFPNVSIGNPVMCYSEHRFRLKACRNDIVLAETIAKANYLLNGFNSVFH